MTAKNSPTPEPELSRAECVVGMECRIYRDKKWHAGKIIKIHKIDNGLQLYRFQSPNLYVLVTRGELKKPTKENT